MCEAIGHPVVRLKRVRFGPIVDRTLKVGEHRDLTSHEVTALRRAAGTPGGSAARPLQADGPRQPEAVPGRARQSAPHRAGHRPVPDAGSFASRRSQPGSRSRRK
jgi:hypothetical protein